MRSYKVVNGQVICNVITAASKKGDFVTNIYCGNDINIKGYKHDMDTDDTFVKLEFLNVITKQLVNVEIERNEIGSGKFIKVVRAKGGSIIKEPLMKEFLLEKEQKLLSDATFRATIVRNRFQGIFDKYRMPCLDKEGEKEKAVTKTSIDTFNLKDSCSDNIEVYSRLGWDKADDKVVFKASSCHGFEGETEYVGELKIQPEGSYENVRKMFEKYVWTSVELQTISAIAASATVLNFMAERCDLILSNIICSLASATTTGKSTAMELAASFGGCPIIGESNTMNLNFAITLNKILDSMGNNKGFPRGIDDTRLADDTLKNQMSGLLYALANGSDKERMHSHETAEFKTAIFITGEKSLRTYVNDFGGLIVRVLEFRDVMWTKNASDAEEIAAIVRQNYGHITPLIAEKLLDYTKENRETELKERYFKWHKTFVDDAREKGVYIEYTERIVTKLALIMLSLELLGEVMEHAVNKKEVYEFLFKHILIAVAQDVNIGERAYNAIVDYWKEHSAEFIVSKKPFVTFSDEDKQAGSMRLQKHMGVVAPTKSVKTINGVNYKRVICLTCNQAKKILAKAGLDNEKKAMEEVGKMGLLMKHNPNTDNPIGFYISGGENMKGYKVLLEGGDDTKIFDSLEDNVE